MTQLVMCHGVFDLLHPGHIEHLRQARCCGTHLYVSLVPGKFATKRPPIYTDEERFDMLIALQDVDVVDLCDGPGPEKLIERWRPKLYIRGSEYVGKEMPESALLKALGIPVVYTQPIPLHTSDIIARIKALP